jgi:hypothetical protein
MPTIALPVISAITAGLLIVGQMGLMLTTAAHRRATCQALGDGDGYFTAASADGASLDRDDERAGRSSSQSATRCIRTSPGT